MRKLLIICVLGLALVTGSTGTAQSQSLRDTLISELSDQGYDEIKSWRTLLGRVRITAENRDFFREIVINPRTNVVLRDYLRRKVHDGTGVSLHDPYEDNDDNHEEGSGSGSGYDDDDDRDDDDDDDDEDDDDDDEEEDDEEDEEDDDDDDEEDS